MSIVYGDSLQIRKQPTISSAATAYAAGDIMGAIQTLQAGYGAINGNPRHLIGHTVAPGATGFGQRWNG